MAQSSHGLVRALGLAALSWYTPGGVVGDNTRSAFNSLAELCPTSKSTREVLHRLMLEVAGADPAHSQAVQDLVSRSDWNPAVQALLANDPVVDLVRDASTAAAQTSVSAEKNAAAAAPADSGIASVLTLAQNSPDTVVKDWCLRLVHAHGAGTPAAATAFCEAVRSQGETVAKSAGGKPKSVSPTALSVLPLETLRAHHVLFMQALRSADLTTAGTQLEVLMASSSADEPLDSNTSMNVLLDGVQYAMQLVMKGENAKAIAVYERIAQRYPNSDVARRSLEHIEHIEAVMAAQQK